VRDALALERNVLVLSGTVFLILTSLFTWYLLLPLYFRELGANDALRGQDPFATKDNLEAIVSATRARYPEAAVVIAGMEAPPNLGEEYTRTFRSVFPAVADGTGAELVPFILQGVAGVPALNQDDGIHPTPEGHRIMADNVWPTLSPLLQDWWRRHPDGRERP